MSWEDEPPERQQELDDLMALICTYCGRPIEEEPHWIGPRAWHDHCALTEMSRRREELE